MGKEQTGKPRTVAIGIQDFGNLIRKNCFYVDKTSFIKEWWESEDSVTLIARPRRFGKTLNMSMLEHFFSNEYAKEGEIFEGLSIWNEEKYRELQGTYPVISLTFANVKETSYQQTKERIYQILTDLYSKNIFLLESGILTEKEKEYFNKVDTKMDETTATMALHQLSKFLSRYYNKKVIILLDEYDTPMQEAYVDGFWDEMVAFTRSMFNAAFKTNPYLERAIMTGITRVSKESIFSDLNNLKVVTTTSDEYATAFGFTEEEVFASMDEMGMTDKEEVKRWYDGFVFGSVHDIYNPWSIINFLDTGRFTTYWANTSANSLVGKLLREGSSSVKETFETLIAGGSIRTTLDEQIVYNQLGQRENAIWSLLLASGYLRVIEADIKEERYELALTNYEVKRMFQNMVSGWFDASEGNYNDFIKALLHGDKKAMNAYMNRVALSTFSYFDTGNRPSGAEPERFYHGFVLGLMVDLRDRYKITSNRESGFGRYDVLLEPLRKEDDGIILEFKVYDEYEEKTLSDTVAAALGQIEEKQYEKVLLDRGVPKEKIRKYGFAFEGKKVLIG
ncbi:MAG: AAA family ATPase [Lachnospiraceae bacterium]|nr:AAA family ATPase [Lachnospiraceae bacterium]